MKEFDMSLSKAYVLLGLVDHAYNPSPGEASQED
jgi:hypothetical protein